MDLKQFRVSRLSEVVLGGGRAMIPFFKGLGLSFEGGVARLRRCGNTLLIALPVMLAVALVIYADRKIWAAMALRKGPNMVGRMASSSRLRDGLKVFLQETIVLSGGEQGPVPDRAE